MSIVRLNGLFKSYGEIKALDDLNLEIPRGCLFGFLGPNGAGKSTTLRILCTLLSPDKGEVFVAGHDALKNPLKVRRALGYVAQEVALDKILTGRELLDLQSDLYHLKGASKKEKIEELIYRLGMDKWIDRRCGSLSGGMKRRLDLASGLLHDPQILVLDEPTVGLDIESRNVIWKLLKELKNQGTTIILSSHYLEEIDLLADVMAIIDQGKVIATGSPNDLKKELGGDRITLRVREFSDENESIKITNILKNISGVRDVVVNKSQGFSLNLVVDNETVLSKLREQLENERYKIFSLSQSKPSLDDVYLQATGRTLMDAELLVAGKRDYKLEIKKSMR